mgnify:CR=1 FL=1
MQRGVRLVTIIGPPGVGKTRLALQAAEELQDQFAAGVVFVDLAPLANEEQVVPAFAEALGLGDLSASSRVSALQSALRRKNMLLVFDNFEHVIGAAPQLVSVLGGSLKSKALATSREILRIAGEHEYALPPLPLPTSPPACGADAGWLAASQMTSHVWGG